MRYKYITKIEIKFDKKKTFKRKSIKYLQNYIFQESVKLPEQLFRNAQKNKIFQTLLTNFIIGISHKTTKFHTIFSIKGVTPLDTTKLSVFSETTTFTGVLQLERKAVSSYL